MEGERNTGERERKRDKGSKKVREGWREIGTEGREGGKERGRNLGRNRGGEEREGEREIKVVEERQSISHTPCGALMFSKQCWKASAFDGTSIMSSEECLAQHLGSRQLVSNWPDDITGQAPVLVIYSHVLSGVKSLIR